MIKNRAKQVPFLARAAGAYRLVQSRLARSAWILDGTERGSGARLALLFSGQPANKHYLAHLLFDGAYREHYLRIPGWKLERVMSDGGLGHSLAVHERERCPGALPAGTFFIPCWVGGEIDLATAERLRKSSGRVNADLRRIRKRAYDVLPENGSERLSWFYETMYLPYVRAVFGTRAFIVSKSEVEAKADAAELIVVYERGEAVAAQIMLRENACVRAWLIGVKDGETRYVRDGAIAAIYHFTTRYFAAKGFERIHAGASRAFLSDGVLQYKKKWGMRLTDATRQGFVLTLARRSAGVDSFLARNPFVYRRADKFYGAVFALRSPGPSAAELDMLRLDGMAGFTVFRPLLDRPSTSGWTAAGFRR